MITVGGEADEMLVEQKGDVRLRDDALDQGTTVPSSLAAELDEDVFACALGLGHGVSQARMPADRAAVVKVWM